jgi:hypothetical protein
MHSPTEFFAPKDLFKDATSRGIDLLSPFANDTSSNSAAFSMADCQDDCPLNRAQFPQRREYFEEVSSLPAEIFPDSAFFFLILY